MGWDPESSRFMFVNPNYCTLLMTGFRAFRIFLDLIVQMIFIPLVSNQDNMYSTYITIYIYIYIQYVINILYDSPLLDILK